MNDTQMKLLTMQSGFHKDCNTIIDLIVPIVCNKKITKREIDKANEKLLSYFGQYVAYKNDKGESVYIPHYTVSLQVESYGSSKLHIYKHNRSLQGGEHTAYMYENDRTIYLESDRSISNEVIQRYKFDRKYMPTIKQIEKAYEEYVAIEAKEKALRDRKSSLPFYYYFDK